MYKVIWLTKFRADMPREEVLAWWRGPHADLAKATPGMIRYVQSYWTSALDDDTQLPTGELGAVRRPRRALVRRPRIVRARDGEPGVEALPRRRPDRLRRLDPDRRRGGRNGDHLDDVGEDVASTAVTPSADARTGDRRRARCGP